MMYAHDTDGARVFARPDTEARCPQCAAEVVPKCGELTAWHWAHHPRLGGDCDPWAEVPGLWHFDWQKHAAPEFREVVVGEHLAPLRSPGGLIVELREGSLSPAEIREREDYYGDKLIWLWSARDAWRSQRFAVKPPRPDGYVTFRWKQPRKVIAPCRRPVYLDLGVDPFMARNLEPSDLRAQDVVMRLGRARDGSRSLFLPGDDDESRSTGGWGFLEPRSDLIDEIKGWS